MLNYIWVGMMLISLICGLVNGTLSQVVQAVTTSAQAAFQLILSLIGIMTLWLGLMKIAQAAGLVQWMARLLKPLLMRLFPEVPADDPAMGSILLNIAANMLGLSNAATPFGLQAMQDLERLNPNPGVASNAMCTFLAINTSSTQLIPTTAIAYLAAAGSHDPTTIILPVLLATLLGTSSAIAAVKFFQRWPVFAMPSLNPIPVINKKEN